MENSNAKNEIESSINTNTKINPFWAFLSELDVRKDINEIMINGAQNIFVEQKGKFIQLKADFSKKNLYDFIDDVAKFNKKECSEEFPILDGILPNGNRINIVVEPVAHGNPAISIRKYVARNVSLAANPNLFGLGEKWASFFQAVVKAKCNCIVSGGSSVGKTTFLNLLLSEINLTERIVVIEDTRELSLNIPNLVRLESVQKSIRESLVSMQELVKNSLRMRPDRIIVGEVRGPEAFDLLQAMNTGHDGSLSSLHANSTRETFFRLETLCLLSGYELPLNAIRAQMASAIDFIIHLKRSSKGERYVSVIRELTGMEGDTISSQDIAVFKEGQLQWSGNTPEKFSDLVENGGLPKDFFEKL